MEPSWARIARASFVNSLANRRIILASRELSARKIGASWAIRNATRAQLRPRCKRQQRRRHISNVSLAEAVRSVTVSADAVRPRL
jgi:hypothetical protein